MLNLLNWLVLLSLHLLVIYLIYALNIGVFPDNMKVAEVIPIFKQSSKMNCSNNRPISILSPFRKVFEKIVCKLVYTYLLKFKLLSPNQFRFQCGVSTSHAVSVVYDDQGRIKAGAVALGPPKIGPSLYQVNEVINVTDTITFKK